MTLAEPITPLEVLGTTTDSSAIHRARRGRSPFWIAELSQIWGGSCWLYFGFALDLRTGRCLGWSAHQVPHAGLIVDALLQATATDPTVGSLPVPVVFGRGTLNTDLMPPRWAIASAPEAWACESFLAAMRRELVDEDEATEERAGRSLPEARRVVMDWIEGSYNARQPRRGLRRAA